MEDKKFSFFWSPKKDAAFDEWILQETINYPDGTYRVISCCGRSISPATCYYLGHKFGSMSSAIDMLSKYTQEEWDLFHMSEVFAGRAKSPYTGGEE